MLKSSTKSVARDVVSTLIDPSENEGVLLKMTKLIETLPEYEVEEDEGIEENKGIAKNRSKPGSKRRSSRESSDYMKE